MTPKPSGKKKKKTICVDHYTFSVIVTLQIKMIMVKIKIQRVGDSLPHIVYNDVQNIYALAHRFYTSALGASSFLRIIPTHMCVIRALGMSSLFVKSRMHLEKLYVSKFPCGRVIYTR
jgi:hypothetical protein